MPVNPVATVEMNGEAAPSTGTPTPNRTFQWYKDGVAIPGATSINYTPTAADVGSTFFLRQTEQNVAGTKSVDSPSTIATVAYSDNALRDIVIARLFGNGEQGALGDPSDGNTCFQDLAMTTLAGADDPVRVMFDVSGNDNHGIAPNDAARPIRRTDGASWWLDFDGLDDVLIFGMSDINLSTSENHAFYSLVRASFSENADVIWSRSGLDDGIVLRTLASFDEQPRVQIDSALSSVLSLGTGEFESIHIGSPGDGTAYAVANRGSKLSLNVGVDTSNQQVLLGATRGSAPVRFFEGGVSFFVVCEGDVDDATRGQIDDLVGSD